jgi:V-type H+-transporting ATPase subunit H
VLSSFEQYKAEVLSGGLDWTPMHKDASFWRENIGKFEENDFQVRQLPLDSLTNVFSQYRVIN